MNNTQTKLQQLMRTEVQNNPQQLNQKSSILAEKIKDKQPRKLALRFSPTAWAKLLYFRNRSDNEIGGFGITEADDLLFVREFVTVKQEVTSISVKFDDVAVSDFFDAQVDLGRKPEQFARSGCIHILETLLGQVRLIKRHLQGSLAIASGL